MLDVEKLMRAGKSTEDIEKYLREQIAVYEQKIEQEKEAERLRKIKEADIEQLRVQAEKALQAYYDAIKEKYLSVVTEDGKVTVSAKPIMHIGSSGVYKEPSLGSILKDVFGY